MSIQFACPKCARGYSVKDELAGKGAKCGQCGHKMTIPAAATKAAASPAGGVKASASVSSKSSPAKAPAAKSPAASSASKPAASKLTASKSVAAKIAATPVAKAKPMAPKTDAGTSSWLDEELETARVEVKAKPVAPPTDASCPSCNAPVMPGAVICVKCGYDKRIRGRHSVEHVDEDAAAPKRSKVGHMGSLLRGTFFSFLGAMLGAIIWALLAYVTTYEFRIVAWGLGGLAGFGMALGHEDDDGTFAGIIAAFMSLLGIVAAKVFIVIIVIAALVSSAVDELQNDPAFQALGEPVEVQRQILANALAAKELESTGENVLSAGEERMNQALEKSQQEVANLSPEEIEARLNALGEEEGVADDFDDEEFDEDEDFDADNLAAADDEQDAMDDDVLSDEEEEAVGSGSLVGMLFSPMDGLWILLAFFTAYKVGAGQSGD